MTSDPTYFPRRIVLGIFLSILLLMVFWVLRPFLVPVAWAGVLVYVSWPFYVGLRRRMGGRSTIAALMMTSFLALLLILPLLWVMNLLQGELGNAYQRLIERLGQGKLILPPELQAVPWAGHELQSLFDRFNANPQALQDEFKRWGEWMISHAGVIADGVGRNIAKLGLAIFTAFFFYRDGEIFMSQLRRLLRRVLDERVDHYLGAIGATARAVVYGIGLTALAQGFLAGIGYAVAGVQSPVFLAVLTTLIAFIPFGTPFAWGGVSVWLLISGHTWAAIGLAIWGTVVVSWVDNIIRPLVISSATQIPFLLVMFGVLGGLAAFGMIGLFMGPVILAVMVAVWREWLEHADDLTASSQENTET